MRKHPVRFQMRCSQIYAPWVREILGPLMTARDRGDSEFSARIWVTLTKPSSDGIATRLRKEISTF